MNFNDIVNIITETIGANNNIMAGTIIYIFIFFLVISITYKKSLILTLLIMMPITFLFMQYQLLNVELATLLTVFSILGIAMVARQVIK